eukprot:TRINITY_DN3338_c1_g1_i2.p1 TRINITY_DN3338_c1_g1~~TRINITY_DN3338_c1_g1_i2.p1  ORF type:complete len:590 (+),score=252.31 TRINITY_DN3338_c1_g1_i2:74-1843(+)
MLLSRLAGSFKSAPKSSVTVRSFAKNNTFSLSKCNSKRIEDFAFKNANKSIFSSFRKFSTEKEEELLENQDFKKIYEQEKSEEPQPIHQTPVNDEKVTGPSDKHEFQAETRKLLDIVAKSLYTEREVFVRELVSNASDALEKARHLQSTGSALSDAELPLEVNIYSDPTKKTLIIQDSGIGMDKKDLVQFLGRIGHSGSAEFVKNMGEKGSSDIIGQFGVGFYSVFMVADKVEVFSKSAKDGSEGYLWTSDGSGSYEIAPATGVARGTKIVMHLNAKSDEFCLDSTLDRVVKKYSNFVGFPIKLNGNQINTVKPLWTMQKSQITAEEHKEFYRFISKAYDDPMMHLHFSTDSPISIRSLLYVGTRHSERYGMGQMEPGVMLFSRKVLIQAKAKILPDWLRFIKGVVDSEDLPLNLSREFLQDSALVKRIGNTLTRRILKWFDEESKKNPEVYKKFWAEFGSFFKEGVSTDMVNKEDIAKLIRLETTTEAKGTLVGFEEYKSKMKPGQEKIFYFCVPNREMAMSSPYMEAFKEAEVGVLLCYTAIDDFMIHNLQRFQGTSLESITTEEGAASLRKLTKKTKKKRWTKLEI